jgi:hypothetical protein
MYGDTKDEDEYIVAVSTAFNSFMEKTHRCSSGA